MHVFIVAGSRNTEGRTAMCARAITKGLEKRGATAETVFLPTMKLERCRQCNPDGWGKCRTEGQCVIKDDFASLVDKIKAADLVVFANPVYFRDLCEAMRSFLDRVRRLNFMQPTRPFNGKPAMSLCLAGGGGSGTTNANFNMDTILTMCGFDLIDALNVRRQNIDMKLPILEMTGEWLASKPTSGPWPPPGVSAPPPAKT